MKKMSVLVSLTTKDNDYQQEQAAAAEQAARRLGIDVQIVFADNDAITQSQQLLKVIQATRVRAGRRHGSAAGCARSGCSRNRLGSC
jgi:ABC-type sugar transport system substrate-binding protein